MKKALAICAALFAVAFGWVVPGYAQSGAAIDPDEARIEDIITASHILTNEGILDSFGHIDAQAQAAALALSPKITVMDAAELANNAAENFDADRPWQNYKQRLPTGH